MMFKLKCAIVFLILIIPGLASGQSSLELIVKDSITHETLTGVTIIADSGTYVQNTDINGKAEFKFPDFGNHLIEFKLIGYKQCKKKFKVENGVSESKEVLLSPNQQELEEVTVSVTRTNSRLEDLNTKVEVLGKEEMDEESALVPGSVASILGDLSVITVQRTNLTNGNDAIRMQGLDPRYTQLMRDGIPLYGGFSGSLGVLAIPPLDLKQVEIIKGSSSTLYGAGAIGGLINFISREPADSFSTTFLLNSSTLREYNVNSFTSGKSGKVGFSLFAGYNKKTAADPDHDGFAEVPEVADITLNPRIFWELSRHTTMNAGWMNTVSTRKGGDLYAISNGADSLHPYLINDDTRRNVFDFQLKSEMTPHQLLTAKGAWCYFQRKLKEPNLLFQGNQHSGYFETHFLVLI